MSGRTEGGTRDDVCLSPYTNGRPVLYFRGISRSK